MRTGTDMASVMPERVVAMRIWVSFLALVLGILSASVGDDVALAASEAIEEPRGWRKLIQEMMPPRRRQILGTRLRKNEGRRGARHGSKIKMARRPKKRPRR